MKNVTCGMCHRRASSKFSGAPTKALPHCHSRGAAAAGACPFAAATAHQMDPGRVICSRVSSLRLSHLHSPDIGLEPARQLSPAHGLLPQNERLADVSCRIL